MASRRSTNFHQGVRGNSLHAGQDLTITVKGSPVYIIGRLFKRTFYGKKLIQIEQTGSRQNPEKNSITFEMKERKGGKTVDMPPGKYTVSNYAYFSGMGGKRWVDDFEII